METPAAEPAINQVLRAANKLPDGVPYPRTVADVAALYAASLYRVINAVVQAQIQAKEGGRLPEPEVLGRNLSQELSPNGCVAYRWRAEAIVVFTPASFRMSDAPGHGLEWAGAKIDVLSTGSRIVHPGEN